MSVTNSSALTTAATSASHAATAPVTYSRYTLLTHLTPEEASVAAAHARSRPSVEPEWVAPGLGATTGQPPLEVRASALTRRARAARPNG